MNQDKIMITKDVAETLKVSETTIIRWIKGGKLPAFRIGKDWRIRKDDLDRFLDEQVNKQKNTVEKNNEKLD